MAKSKIEWTDETWNPITGCEPVSEGCDNCYAQRMAKRLKAMGQEKYQNGPDGFEPTFHESELDRPLSWKKPKRVFVCSMSDIAWASHTELARLYARMAVSQQCTFQILTKRPESISAIFRHVGFREYVEAVVNRLMDHARLNSWNTSDFDWPPKNVWVGVTAENQRRADERIPKLLQIPAAVRFVSCEPLLGPVNLDVFDRGCGHTLNVLSGIEKDDCGGVVPRSLTADNAINWVIAGGESGPGARPTHPDWVRSLRDQCQAADVPFLFKQWGKYWPSGPRLPDRDDMIMFGNEPMYPVGKKKAGRELDGRTWDQFPEEVSDD